jgi:hypothetical protein
MIISSNVVIKLIQRRNKMNLKPFYFKVESCGSGGDNYIGYWLILAYDTVHAIELLKGNKNFMGTIKSHPPRINQVNAEDMLNNFSSLVYEITFDCYN